MNAGQGRPSSLDQLEDDEADGASPGARREEPAHPRMGERLRAARQARALSLRDLAERVGVSASLISQVETGRARPSVNTLYALAAELEVSLDELHSTTRTAADRRGDRPGRPRPVARSSFVANRSSARPTASASASRRRGLGAPDDRLEPDIDFLYVTYEVGGASSPEHEFQRHGGQRMGLCPGGSARITVGFEEHVLGPGDAIALDSTTPHRLVNRGDVPVHAVWFVLGRRARLPGTLMGSRDARRRHVDWSFADTPTPTTASVNGLARQVIVGTRPGRRPHRACGGRPPSRRLHRPSRPLVRGGAVRPRWRAARRARRHRPRSASGRLHGDAAGASTRTRQPVRCADPVPVGEHAPTAATRCRAARHVLPGRAVRPRGVRGPCRPSAIRRPHAPLRRSLRRDTATGGGPPARRPRPRPEGGGHGYRVGRVLRHLREDARRPGLRGRPADDVHGRLRGRRVGAAARPPVRGGYFFLAGEVEAELDGEHHVLRPGDVVFAGVGSVHGFYNTGSERVRWLETQAPQPPTRHAYRWLQHWERFEREGRV